MSADKGPIGVFDSGVGGLTVVGALLRRFPNERILYVADQAHVPYGGRPLDEIRGFATEISRFLAAQGCRAIVMACNISSATALPSVRAAFSARSLPVLGVIEPAARRAVVSGQWSVDSGQQDQRPNAQHPTPDTPVPRSGETAHPKPAIGILATEGTVRSNAYLQQIQALDPLASVTQIACPKLVPLVEAGDTETPEAEAAAREYLTPPAKRGCQTIILGCTHYPFLLPTFRRVAAELFPSPVTFVDPADEMAEALCAALPDLGEAPPGPSPIRHLLLTTGNADNFQHQATRFLPGIKFETGTASWKDNRLRMKDEG